MIEMPNKRLNRSLLAWGRQAITATAVVCVFFGTFGWGSRAGFFESLAAARDLTPYMGRPSTQRKHFQGDPVERAGHPEWVSPLAKPTKSSHEEGYFIGGGARVKSRGGQERRIGEGTWGTDYTGLVIPKKTNLLWWHGQRYQGGVGSYRTDGPRIVHKP
jgi:hypothetical protein